MTRACHDGGSALSRAVRFLWVALALSLGLLAGPAAAKEWTDIRIATEGAYPPWNYTDDSGQLIGFEIDLAHDLCRRMAAACELVTKDWDSLIPGLEAGDYDAIMDGIAMTEARAQKVRFSESYATIPARFAVRKDSALAELSSRHDRLDLTEVDGGEQAALDALRDAFAGKTVGVEVASPSARFLRTFMAEPVEVREYTTLEGLDLDLEAKRIDLALASMSHWRLVLASAGGKDFTLVGSGLTGGPFGPGIGVGVRPADGDLALLFNRAIDAARTDGSIARLAQQWFGYDVLP